MGLRASLKFLAAPRKLQEALAAQLFEFATQTFAGLGAVASGLAPVKNHLAAAEASLAKMGISVEAPKKAMESITPCPWQLEYLWAYYWEIAPHKSSNGFALNPISIVDLEAASRQLGMMLDPWESRVLLKLDKLFLRQQAINGRRDADDKSKHRAPARR